MSLNGSRVSEAKSTETMAMSYTAKICLTPARSTASVSQVLIMSEFSARIWIIQIAMVCISQVAPIVS